MEKEILTLIVCPQDLYWASEIEVQLNNFRKFDHRNCHILIYERDSKVEENKAKDIWNKLQEEYKDIATFFFYQNENIRNLLSIYIPVSRPDCLRQHFEKYPELKDKVILYMDSDVIFTKKTDFSPYLNDDICYLSKTDYISAKYFANKEKDVYQHRLSDYKKIDVLKDLASIVGIDKQVIVDNQENTGGCQYILKNIDSQFWADVEKHCVELRLHMLQVNATYFPNEDTGFQSWCSDMLAVLWNLFKRNQTVKCPNDLNFAWSSSPIEEFDKNIFLQNAGITSKYMTLGGQKELMFYKSDIRFRASSITFFDITDWGNISDKYCSIKYLEAIQDVTNPISHADTLKY